jgi:hypothetical protein
MAGGKVLTAAGATASPVQVAAAAQTRNALLWVPTTDVGQPSVITGTLLNTVGGRQTNQANPDRVAVFLAPGATLRGVAADLYQRYRPAGAAEVNPFDELRVAQAVWVYNEAFLTAAAPAWRVGLWLPMPIEVEGLTWTTDWETVLSWADRFPPARFAELDTPAAALPLPDPDALVGEAAAWVAAHTLAPAAAELAFAIVANPFECVFRTYEIFRRLPATGATSRETVAIAVVDALSGRELTAAAHVTAGNAVLRRLWAALATATSGGAAGARDRLAPALGLAGSAGAWTNPADRGPTVVPLELPREVVMPGLKLPAPKPATQKPTKLTGEDPNGRHVLVLGRDVCTGNLDSYTQKNGTSWTGPSYTGRVRPAAWVAAHAGPLRLTSTVEQARLDVAVKIAENEAYLDGSRGADKGTLSSGIQQSSIHLDDELPALLERFRVGAPDHYDLFFGMYGLQSRIWARTGPGLGDAEAPPTPPQADVQRDNPEAFTGGVPDTDPKSYDVAYATVGQVPPGGAWTLLPQPPGSVTSVGPRHAFFGVTKTGLAYTVADTWCARVRLAALCSTDYRLCQLWTAVYRFERLRRQVGTIKVDGVDHSAADLLRSQFAAAAALDEHVNAPWQVRGNLQGAVQRVAEASAANPDSAVAGEMRPHESPADPTLRVPWLLAFAVNYVSLRQPVGKEHRDATLLHMHDLGLATVPAPGLSSQPGSFLGW